MSPDSHHRHTSRTRRSRHSAIYGKLKADLVSCRLRPSQHLSIARLSLAFRSSNTPVREALIRLHAERLVAVDTEGGFRVRELHLGEMRDLLMLARLIIPRCLSGARRGFPFDHISAPAALAQKSRYRASRVLQAQSAETAFFIERIYSGVAEMSANEEIALIVDNICDRTHFVRTHDIQAIRRGKWLADELHEIVAALSRGDHDDAASRIDRFLQMQIDRLPEVLPKALAAIFLEECN